VETQLIEGEFHPKAYPKAAQDEGRFDAPNAYKVMATLDLDGDGKMEIVIGSHYYEGEMTTIYRCDPKRLRLCSLFRAARNSARYSFFGLR
jgi:FG-GAP repeat protein